MIHSPTGTLPLTSTVLFSYSQLTLLLENLATWVHDHPDEETFDVNLDNHKRPDIDSQPEQPDKRASKTTYLVKLEGPLSSASHIQNLAKLSKTPIIRTGTGLSGNADFCLIDGRTKHSLTSALSRVRFSPTFIHINMAAKELSSHSIAPKVGLEFESTATLPHNRPDSPDHVFLPAQNQYPVWYFFYGTLLDPEFLGKKLGLSETPVLIKGGIVKMWGQYKALVDGPASSTVNGWAYENASEEDEDKLRYFETDWYEVVRCDIVMVDGGETVKGLTFRFADESEL